VQANETAMRDRQRRDYEPGQRPVGQQGGTGDQPKEAGTAANRAASLVDAAAVERWDRPPD
jgi:hypothetical protein